MIAILKSEIEAVKLSDTIHDYLTNNVKDYRAKKWSELNKSDSANLLAVKIPKEFKYIGETVDKLPDNWVINKDYVK